MVRLILPTDFHMALSGAGRSRCISYLRAFRVVLLIVALLVRFYKKQHEDTPLFKGGLHWFRLSRLHLVWSFW